MANEIKEKISLDNFNYKSKNQRLTSPLSIKACRLQGVTEEDLIFITFEEYMQIHSEWINLPKEFQQERYDNFEQNRKDLIETLKEIRNDLISERVKLIKKQKTEPDYDEYNQCDECPHFLLFLSLSKYKYSDLSDTVALFL